MSGFPIAVGAGPRHSSSRPFPQGEHVTMAMGMDDDETLTATVFISYHFHPANDNNNNDTGSVGRCEETNNINATDTSRAELLDDAHFNAIAEVRVLITHSTSPLVSNKDAMSNRETKSRVPLGIMKKRRRRRRSFTPNASVTFSSNRSHLACLIPVPSGYELVSSTSAQHSSTTFNVTNCNSSSSVSTVVIFNIQTYAISSRQQIRQQNRALPKLPDYILEPDTASISKTHLDGESNEAIQLNSNIYDAHDDEQEYDHSSYVAHVPKIVRFEHEGKKSSGSAVYLPSLQNAACMCNLPSDSHKGKGSTAFSSLLVGTTDGSLLLIDFATAKVKDVLYGATTHTAVSPIIHLSQCPPTVWKGYNKYGDEMGSKSKGRIAAVTRDGGISIFNTSFHGVNQENSSIDQSGRDYANESGLIMSIECFAQIHPSDTNNESGLRFSCTNWINPLVLTVLTRSRLLDEEDFPRQRRSSLTEFVVAQVWLLPESESPVHAMAKPNISVLSELKFPCEDSLLEQTHGTFSVSCQDTEPESSYGKSYYISYNKSTDCIAVSSQFISFDPNAKKGTKLKVRPFCMTWDWKRKAQGLTLTADVYYLDDDISNIPDRFSQFVVTNDCAIHLYENTHAQSKLIQKDIFNLSTLSPPPVSHKTSTIRLCEPSALMLRGDAITYPLIDRPLATPNFSLRWEESRIPSSYYASNGPCRIAAIGKERGRSIAVAASRGLCILDLSRHSCAGSKDGNEVTTPCVKCDSDTGAPRSQHLHVHSAQWRLFSNVTDEQQFRVVGLVWWETSSNDDFILAVVRYVADDKTYLVCWSKRRLGFGESQLLVEQNEYFARHDDDSKSLSSHGLALPDGFRVDALSLLKDPAGSDRALLLLSSTSDSEKSCGISYALYQLQTKTQSQNRPKIVLAKLSADSNIPITEISPDLSTTDSITGMFLAGGSFAYDLYEELNDKSDVFGIFGITSLFLDLCMVCVNRRGPILCQPCHSKLQKRSFTSECSPSTNNSIVASYWMSDSLSSDDSCGRIVWNIAKNDGKVYCWEVPCTSSRINTESNQLKPPMLPENYIKIGHASLWLNGATLNGNDIALGAFLSNNFGCTLYAGQSSRAISPNSDANYIFSFHVSNCIIGSPQFTPALYISFLHLAKMNSMATRASDLIIDEKEYIRTALLKAKKSGSSSSALRIITLKVVELLDTSKGNHAMIQHWNEGMRILRDLVSVTRVVFNTLSFASFFLSIGRQMEPHQFDLIFPLPSEGCTGISAEDLFMIAVKKGSLAVALSGLSLFSYHVESQNRVVQLLCHCFVKIDEALTSSVAFSSEEEKFLHQLFWFGVKLEDAMMAETAQEVEDATSTLFDPSESIESALMSNSSTSFDESSYASSDEFSIESEEDPSENSFESEIQDVSFISCRSQNRKPREGLVTKVVSRLFHPTRASKNNSFEEDAIYEAATSFITSGFDYNTTPTEACNGEAKHQAVNTQTVTVAGSASAFLSYAVGLGNMTTLRSEGWKVVSIIAYLIQGDRDSLSIIDASSLNAVRISRLVTLDELHDYACTFDARMGSERDRGNTQNQLIMSCLEQLSSKCRQKIHSDAVESILNLVLLLILRHDSCEDVQLHRGALILIGIVCGHLCGRITDLIDVSEESDVHLIYQAFAQQYHIDS